MRFLALAVMTLGAVSAFAATHSLFNNPDITTEYSVLLQEKNARNDSLLPALDGDKAFSELLRQNPNFWSLERLDQEGEMLTKLKAKIIYIDGIREEAYCKLDKNTSQAGEWNLEIGVDFVSAASNTVGIHVQQCLNMVRDELGYLVKKDDKIIAVPPRKVIEKIKEVEIPMAVDIDLQQKLLATHEEVNRTGNCPKGIESYIILRDVWNQVKNEKMDIVTINDKLNSKENGGHSIKTCAFSTEWNKRYQGNASFECDIDKEVCDYEDSEDGKTSWSWNFDENRFEFVRKKFLFIPYGSKSVHDGGTMMDLRLIRLSTTLYLEGFLDEKGEPVTLGLIILPNENDEYEEYDDSDEDEYEYEE